MPCQYFPKVIFESTDVVAQIGFEIYKAEIFGVSPFKFSTSKMRIVFLLNSMIQFINSNHFSISQKGELFSLYMCSYSNLLNKIAVKRKFKIIRRQIVIIFYEKNWKIHFDSPHRMIQFNGRMGICLFRFCLMKFCSFQA